MDPSPGGPKSYVATMIIIQQIKMGPQTTFSQIGLQCSPWSWISHINVVSVISSDYYTTICHHKAPHWVQRTIPIITSTALLSSCRWDLCTVFLNTSSPRMHSLIKSNSRPYTAGQRHCYLTVFNIYVRSYTYTVHCMLAVLPTLMSNSSWPLTGPISSTLSLFAFFAEGPELVGVSFGPRFDISSVSRTQPPNYPRQIKSRRPFSCTWQQQNGHIIISTFAELQAQLHYHFGIQLHIATMQISNQSI